MSSESVATAIKRFPTCWLHFSGNRHILIKKQDGKYVVKEAEYAGKDRDDTVLRLTGRFFQMGGESHSPVLAGVISVFDTLEPELAVANILGAWGCWPDKFISIRDGMGGGFRLTSSPSAGQ